MSDDRYEEWKRTRLRSDPGTVGGELRFAGTRLTVKHIGALARGHAIELREDYPQLSDEDLEYAARWYRENTVRS